MTRLAAVRTPVALAKWNWLPIDRMRADRPRTTLGTSVRKDITESEVPLDVFGMRAAARSCIEAMPLSTDRRS